METTNIEFKVGGSLTYEHEGRTRHGLVNGEPYSDETGVFAVPVWDSDASNTIVVAAVNIVDYSDV